MGPRTRKAVASIATILFLTVWVILAIGIGLRLSEHWRAPFYAFAGIAWGLPLFPLFTWAEHGRFFKPRS